MASTSKFRQIMVALLCGALASGGTTAMAAGTYRGKWGRTFSFTNTAPTITGTPPSTVVAGQMYRFTPAAADAQKTVLRFSVRNAPAWTSFNTADGTLSGTPSAAQVGKYANIVISVSDGVYTASLPAFWISVTAPPTTPTEPPPPAVNSAPVISGNPATSATAGAGYAFTPTASDANGDPLTFSIANRPAWASFSTTTGRLDGTAQTGTWGNIVISVSDGTDTRSLPAFTITVAAAPVANTAPVISGSPVTSVTQGASYSFTPAASDVDGDTLTFSVANRPSWANFSTATGRLDGTAQAGTYSNVVISVSDGTVTRSLPAFTLVVAQPTTGSAALSWTTPSQNTDGSALTDLAGYRIYHGTSASALNDVVTVQGAGNTAYTFSQLPVGTHYFAVSAYTHAGMESARSGVGSKTVQ